MFPKQVNLSNNFNNYNNNNFIASIAHDTIMRRCSRALYNDKNFNSTIYNQISYMKNGKI